MILGLMLAALLQSIARVCGCFSIAFVTLEVIGDGIKKASKSLGRDQDVSRGHARSTERGDEDGHV